MFFRPNSPFFCSSLGSPISGATGSNAKKSKAEVLLVVWRCKSSCLWCSNAVTIKVEIKKLAEKTCTGPLEALLMLAVMVKLLQLVGGEGAAKDYWQRKRLW